MLSRLAIKSLMEAGLIKITPDPVQIGPNSIDLRLGDGLKMYHPTENRVQVIDPVNSGTYYAIDPKNPPPLVDVPRVGEKAPPPYVNQTPPDERAVGKWLLVPGQFYLGSTMEETYCRGVVPHMDGRSTCGRLSIEAHKTAGVGDNGFRGQWTLEIEVTEPVLVAPGDRLFQVYFTPAWGEGLALILRAMATRERFVPHLDGLIDLGSMEDGCARDCGTILELHDVYCESERHHYQGSEGVRAPAPLD